MLRTLSNRQGGVIASPCYQKFFYFAEPQSIFIGALRVEQEIAWQAMIERTARLTRKSLRFRRKQARPLTDIAQPSWLFVLRKEECNVSRYKHNHRNNYSPGLKHLDHWLLLIYYYNTERYHQAHEQCQCGTTQAEHGETMRTREELMKIKEAFAYAMIDMLDVYDELLATGRVWVADEPTVNDLTKNQEESNA